MTKETKLKPCLFCGQDSAGFANAGFGFIVKCRKCGTKTDKQNTTEEAAAFWNERKPLSDIVPSNSIEFLVKFTRVLADILSENKRLREALTFYAKGKHLGLEDWQTEQVLKDDEVFAESYCETGKVAREALKGGE